MMVYAGIQEAEAG
ncbi:rCG41411, partial [Rattus norvegicus]